MNNKNKYAIGIDLGGTSIKLGIVSDSGRIHKKTKLRTEADKGPKHVIENIKIGMKVENTFRKIQDDGYTGAIYYGYKFKPLEK